MGLSPEPRYGNGDLIFILTYSENILRSLKIVHDTDTELRTDFYGLDDTDPPVIFVLDVWLLKTCNLMFGRDRGVCVMNSVVLRRGSIFELIFLK